jgi:acetyl-CoA C-acetyltransferase
VNDAVAIVGYAAQSGPADVPRNLEDMILGAARGALASAALARDDVGAIVISASDQIDGRAISSMLTGGPAGAFLNDEINIASSPGHAFVIACLEILSGQHERILLTSWGKASEIAVEGGTAAAERLSADPVYERDAGLEPVTALGLQAGLHRARARGGEAAARAVVIRNRANAARNERAVGRAPVDERAIAGSALLAHPLRALELPPVCDGAYSLVLAAAGDAPAGSPVVEGFGWCADSSRLGERDLLGLPHLRSAAAAAYERAGVQDPRAELDLCELHAASGDAEVLAYPALGLCEEGCGADFARSGVADADGDLPVNPSGGPFGGEAPFGGGLRTIVETVRQLRGEAGAVGEAGARRALAQIATGFAGQLQTVVVLGAGGR